MGRSAVAKKNEDAKLALREAPRPPAVLPFKVPPTERVLFLSLNPATYNPRTISERQLEALKEGIKLHGFVEPFVVQKTGMVIIGGHQRHRAIRELCAEAGIDTTDLHVPAVVLDVGNREAKRLNIALNRVSGDWDEEMLGQVLTDIYTEAPITETEVLVLGFESMGEVGDIIGGELGLSLGDRDDDAAGSPSATRTPSLTLDFSSAAERDAVKLAIVSRAKKKDEPSGSTLARILGVGAKKKR